MTRYRVQLTCEYEQRTKVLTYDVAGPNPLDAVKRAEEEMRTHGQPCEHVVAVHVETLRDGDEGIGTPSG